MKRSPLLRNALRSSALMAVPFTAWAHEGHGAESMHWHATDTWGFLVTIGLVGAALWISRKR